MLVYSLGLGGGRAGVRSMIPRSGAGRAHRERVINDVAGDGDGKVQDLPPRTEGSVLNLDISARPGSLVRREREHLVHAGEQRGGAGVLQGSPEVVPWECDDDRVPLSPHQPIVPRQAEGFVPDVLQQGDLSLVESLQRVLVLRCPNKRTPGKIEDRSKDFGAD